MNLLPNESWNRCWTELKLSWQLHSRAPEQLPAKERQSLATTASRQEKMEKLILGSQEAMCAIVPPGAVESRLAEIRQRYAGDDEMHADLARLGMDEEALMAALTRDLIIDNTLARLDSRLPPVSDTEAEIYYRLHLQRFQQPESRQMRHLLLTFSNDIESRQAYSTLAQLRPGLLAGGSEAFAAAALRHSHCPTALEGGVLGRVRRGQLYPELESAAFALVAGGVSSPVSSEMGWHLLRCDAIHPARLIPFDECRQAISERLTADRARIALRQWLAQEEKRRAG